MKPLFKKLKAKPARFARKGTSTPTQEIINELEERLAKLEAALTQQSPPPTEAPDLTYIPPYNFKKEPLF